MRRFILLIVLVTAALSCRRPAPDPIEGESPPPAPRSATDRLPDSKADDAEEPPETTPRPSRPSGTDDGLLSKYDDAIELHFPEWLEDAPVTRVRGPGRDVFAFVAGRAVGLAPDADVDFEVESFGDADVDGDGIPNGVDVLLGAKKAAENNAPYGSPYREIDYPGGDVPLTEGVCTDTLVRTFRNAGIDLQRELHEEIKRSPRSFPMVKTPNPNIDHRRVKTLLPYFERRWLSLPTDLNNEPLWLPGDVLFMDTYGDDRPDHVGVVSDRLGESGAPLVINNWTNGYATSAMDIATLAPITHRFRLRGTLSAPRAHRGLPGVLRRHDLELPENTTQVILVTTPARDSSAGTLHRYERRDDWKLVGEAVPITLGSNGIGTGRGLHPDDWSGGGAAKREGDRRAPAGVFALGTAFGPGNAPYSGDWPWRPVGPEDVFVDDPESEHYNTWQTGAGDWESAEKLTMYRLGLVVEHNTEERVPGAGSAIFLHTWQGERSPTLGCTAMKRPHLVELLEWLDPDASPVLVQVPGHVWR